MTARLDKAIRDRALQLRHYAAIAAAVETPNVEARYELLIAVVAPSPELAAMYEHAAREELAERSTRELTGAVA